MPVRIEEILEHKRSRDEMIVFLKTHSELFDSTIEYSISDRPEAWRAAWVLGHCMEKNDDRITPFIKKMISAIKGKKDGHQRELLKILMKMQLEDENEGMLFNACMNIWEEIGKSPSVRITAFRCLVRIARKYPELKNELEHLSQDHYTASLSPGIKRSFGSLIRSV